MCYFTQCAANSSRLSIPIQPASPCATFSFPVSRGASGLFFFLERRSVIIGYKLKMTTLGSLAYTLIFTHDSRMMAT